MPQFDFANVFIPQLFWLSVLFAILYFGVVRLTLPKLGTVMEARQNKVTGDIEAAEQSKLASDKMNEDYQLGLTVARDDARSLLADAKSKATASIEKKSAAAQKKADEAIAAAQVEIEKARINAMTEIEAVAAEGASDIVQKLTGKAPGSAIVSKATKSVFG